MSSAFWKIGKHITMYINGPVYDTHSMVCVIRMHHVSLSKLLHAVPAQYRRKYSPSICYL